MSRRRHASIVEPDSVQTLRVRVERLALRVCSARGLHFSLADFASIENVPSVIARPAVDDCNRIAICVALIGQ